MQNCIKLSKCSGSRVIVLTAKKQTRQLSDSAKNNTVVANGDVKSTEKLFQPSTDITIVRPSA